MANTLAYYDTATITVVKGFIVHARSGVLFSTRLKLELQNLTSNIRLGGIFD